MMSRAKIQITILDQKGEMGCHRGHQIGQTFDFDTQRGQLCPMAAHVLFPYIDILRYGGQIPGQQANTTVACCSDVDTILVFYIEKIIQEPKMNQTKRMSCRTLAISDIKTVFAMTKQPEVSKTLRQGVHTSIKQAATLVMNLTQPQNYSFLVFNQENNEPIGVIAAKWVEEGIYDLTIFLTPLYQHDHRGSELVAWLKQELKETTLLTTLQAYVATENLASTTMLQRADFYLAKTMDQGKVTQWVCQL